MANTFNGKLSPIEAQEGPFPQRYVGEHADELRSHAHVLFATTKTKAENPVAEIGPGIVYLLRHRLNGDCWPVGTKLYTTSPLVEEALERALAFLESIHKSGYSSRISIGCGVTKTSPNYELIDQIISQGRAALQLDGDK